MARVHVRFGEIDESLRILRQAIDHLRRGDGELVRHRSRPAQPGSAFGWAEAAAGRARASGWRSATGCSSRLHVASPSLRNWALFDHAFPKDVLTDFAFIEHSFGLTPAGADR